MSSKVLVSLPAVPFQQVSKKSPDLSPVTRPEGYSVLATDPHVRINQLEQNIRYLQEQHKIMLTGLHQEVETLRQRNRDLQFKLVFCKGGVALLQSSPSSPEDDSQRKLVLSPNQVNITPLQIEILERDIAELKTNLSESRTRNVYLQNVVDDQKKRLTGLENEKSELAAVGRKFGKENVDKGQSASAQEPDQETVQDLHDKMEDADRLIRRLRRENEEQRKEIVSLRANLSKAMGDGRRNEGGAGGGGGGHRGHYRNQQTYHSRFPPLHTHNYYNHGTKNCSDYQPRNSDRDGGKSEKEPQVIGKPAPTLPHLRDRNNASTSTGYSNTQYTTGNGNHRRHHYYRKQEEGGERYKGGGRGVRGNRREQPPSHSGDQN